MHPKYYTAPKLTPFMLFAREGEGGGGGEAEAAIQKRIADAVAAEVAGLKAKNDELLGKNKALSESNKRFEGIDVEKYNAFQQRLDTDEDARLISEGKTTELVQKYTERMRKEHETQLAAVRAEVDAEKVRGKKYEQAVLDNQIRAACVGMHPSAIEDALLHGRTVFSLDAEGRAVKADGSGRPELGKDGQTPFSPAEWIESQKESKPHWFPASSSGSGSAGSSGAGAGGKTMSRSKFDSLPASEKATVARSGVKIVD
jgi:hypothetical protein